MDYVTTITDPAISSGSFSARRKFSTPPEPITENSVGCPDGTITWNGKETIKRRFNTNVSL